MKVKNKFQEVFSEIDSINARVSVMGREAKIVLGQLLNNGFPSGLSDSNPGQGHDGWKGSHWGRGPDCQGF